MISFLGLIKYPYSEQKYETNIIGIKYRLGVKIDMNVALFD